MVIGSGKWETRKEGIFFSSAAFYFLCQVILRQREKRSLQERDRFFSRTRKSQYPIPGSPTGDG
ncbi:MAG: hypothetical protein AB4290_13115 [Spirulina sp.]